MDEILSKRIVLLSNALLILCALGCLALIHRIDAGYKEKEYSVLNKLRICIEGIPQRAEDPEKEYEIAKAWLVKNNKNIHDNHTAFTTQLFSQLHALGYADDLNLIKESNVEDAGDLHLINLDHKDSSQLTYPLGALDGTNKLIHFVDQYEHLQKPLTITVPVQISEKTLEAALLKKGIKPRPYKNRETKTTQADNHSASADPELILDRIFLVGDSCKLYFESPASDSIKQATVIVSVPVKTETLVMGTLHQLFEIDSNYDDFSDKHELVKLKDNYGMLPMDKSLDMLSDDYMNAYERIDLFGISLTTTSLPLALLGFFFFISVGILLMLFEARKDNLKIISETQNEDLTDYFLKRFYIRIFIWLVFPLLALGATLPNLKIEPLKEAILLGGALLLLIINSISLVISRKL